MVERAAVSAPSVARDDVMQIKPDTGEGKA